MSDPARGDARVHSASGVLVWGLALGQLTTGLASIPCGWWMDRYGPHLVMTFGAVLGAACLFWWSVVETPFAFYLAFVGIGLAIAATVQDLPYAIASAN